MFYLLLSESLRMYVCVCDAITTEFAAHSSQYFSREIENLFAGFVSTVHRYSAEAPSPSISAFAIFA